MSRCYVKNILLIFFIICLADQSVNAQISLREQQKLFFKADKVYEFGDYPSALEMYKTLYPYDSANAELNFKIGVCIYEIKKDRKSAISYFERTSTSDFPEANYYLGLLYHSQRNFEKAISCLTQYKHLKDEELHSRKEIEDLIGKSNTAKVMESQRDYTLRIKNLGDTINTPYPEYAPLIPAQEDYMLFTSRRKNPLHPQMDSMGEYFEDIYMSKRENKKWLPPVILDTAINTSVHDAGTGLSADGEKLMLFRTSKDLRSGDIYESALVNAKWTKPSLLGQIVNDPEFAESSACYSPDGNTLFFSSNRPGGLGGKDLYAVKKLPNGMWGNPFNLGSTINTEYDEDSPFVHPTGGILFFSSQGHKNMGGYDIFKTFFDEHVKFSPPQNMGSPINTVNDDIFFVLSTDEAFGYFSSEREGGFGSQDIYSVYFPLNNVPLSVYYLHVFDESGKTLTNFDVTLMNPTGTSIYGTYKSNLNNGKVLIIAPPESSYEIIIKSAGHETFSSLVSFGTTNEIIYKLRKVQQ